MRIVNRADLTVDSPAKSGTIIYKYQKFPQEFEKKFGKRE